MSGMQDPAGGSLPVHPSKPMAHHFTPTNNNTPTASFAALASQHQHDAGDATSLLHTPSKKRVHDTDAGSALNAFHPSIADDIPHRPSKKVMDVQIDQLVRSDTDDNEASAETEVFDHNFFDLLSQFTQLDLPSVEVEHLEQCPVCNNTYPLHDFAAHVYTCIKALDDVERNELIRLDAKLARKIAESDESIALQGSLADIDDHCTESKNECESSDSTDSSALAADDENDSLYMNDTGASAHAPSHDVNNSMVDANQCITNTAEDELEYKHTKRRKRRLKRLQLANSQHSAVPTPHCFAGRSCTRTDATHFLLLHHPDVSCPICNVKFAVYEIEGHVVQCLTSERPTRQISGNALTYSSRATTSTASPILQSPDVLDAVTTFQLPPHAETNNTQNNTSTRGTSTIIARNRSSPTLPVTADSDSDDDRSTKYTAKHTPLNIYQASAMAHLVLAQRDKTASQQDYTLNQLLSTFKSLGFDRDNLTSILQSHTTGQGNANGSTELPPAFAIDNTTLQSSNNDATNVQSTDNHSKS